MESEGVSLPLIHDHLMMPCNDQRKGDCCGRYEHVGDGYYCKSCDFFVHKKCADEASESIQHPSHPLHTLELLQSKPYHSCNLCGRVITGLFYRCDICDFDIDLHCAKHLPPDVIDNSEAHQHKLTLVKDQIEFDCGSNCGKNRYGFAYKCHECDLAFHVDCVWRSFNSWHHHLMMPLNDLKSGLESISDGYYCKICDFFVHKKCSELSKSIQHPSHSDHTLCLRLLHDGRFFHCSLCGRRAYLGYCCDTCENFSIDLDCAKYPPPDVIDISETCHHHHKLTLVKERVEFECDAKCGETGDGFLYKCHECDLAFHVDCVWHPPEVKHPLEVNHSYHSLHPLKLLARGQLPDYSDGKCRLCAREVVDTLFYHCSSCNFTLDMHCVLKPPPQSLLDLKAHDHQLKLLPRFITFTCNACGLKGDRSPYACFQCDFMIHQNCLGLPRVININRHDHRVYHISLIGVVDTVCKVCRKKMDWTCGGYSCQRCPGYIVHSKCATDKNVWNGEELEGVPEEIEDIDPYVVIDDNTIQHFSHEEHHLRRNVDALVYEENKRCNACTHPICLQSFYGCMDCDFILHENCAELPKRKWHVLHNDRLTLVTSEADYFRCYACDRDSNGFRYNHDHKTLDVRCSSISEPFFHPSHPQHPLYSIPLEERGLCNGCNERSYHMLRCIENDCGFILDFKCATLPLVVKHRADDYPLQLCYGEKVSGKNWCDICEKRINPEKWFYTCKDNRACLHTECVLGDFTGFMPRSRIRYYGKTFEVVLNNSVTRPFCSWCESRCIYPIILRYLGASDAHFCSTECGFKFSMS